MTNPGPSVTRRDLLQASVAVGAAAAFGVTVNEASAGEHNPRASSIRGIALGKY
ncbi:MAG: twin-arginine translocation signal domain-containing protein [Planctomycetaceae bacterium]|jgi:hypothetical protein|nr:twin-arginine translocation signal domain-containing protein [Planctomycetaceae bacterium]MBT6154635.1 twin-arginine translocation signal domain-containing protein [Planctomycetaceae bacterium]MBT6485372.1 twin-arginine translocation signal domain-containing protein [Planctomycetaceae bacterium]MBT6495127.1 twin-arginine translocation signal domain-containing protein [Planctomycetaceae bacterium]